MPLSSSRKVFKGVTLGEEPVEIKIRESFDFTEDLLEGEQEPRIQKLLRAATEEAKRIKEEAQKKGEEYLAEAKAKRDEFQEQARQEGFQKGYEAGYDKGVQESNFLYEQAEDFLGQARQSYRNLMQQMEPNLQELAILIAEKILRRQIILEPQVIIQIVKEVLEENKTGDVYYIYTHPSDNRILADSIQELKAIIPNGAAIHIVPDKRVNPGGCRLETETAYYDATLDGQLRELRKLLQGGGSNA